MFSLLRNQRSRTGRLFESLCEDGSKPGFSIAPFYLAIWPGAVSGHHEIWPVIRVERLSGPLGCCSSSVQLIYGNEIVIVQITRPGELLEEAGVRVAALALGFEIA